VLEPPVPVLRHLAHVIAQDAEHALDRLLPDHASQPGPPCVLARDHDRHGVVKDLDRQVLALGAEALPHLTLHDLAGAVVGVDHLVADLVLDLRRLASDLEVLDLLLPGCFGNDVLLVVHQVCR
jgi:hypothetical protein